MSRNKRRGGSLSPEDRALWDSVTKSVKPLRPVSSANSEYAESGEKSKRSLKFGLAALPARRKDKTPASDAGKVKNQPAPSLAPPPSLDRRTRQRLAKGGIAIDARIDLHGMTQREAHSRLKSFLAYCQQLGNRHVLVITGKGGAEHDHRDYHGNPGRGVLRRMMPQWLALPEFRIFVVGFEEAHIAHGGAGAFYVRLRRRKPG